MLFCLKAKNGLIIIYWVRGTSEPNLPFCDIFVLLARNFELTKTPRESLVGAFDCRLALRTPLHAV